MSAPTRSDEQRSAALESAQAARAERARLRAALKTRAVSAIDVLNGAEVNPVWAALRVSWLLECLPGIGTIRAGRILESARIAPSRHVQGLGVHQRAALIAELERDGR